MARARGARLTDRSAPLSAIAAALRAVVAAAGDLIGIASAAALLRGVWLLGSIPAGPSDARGQAWTLTLGGSLMLAFYVAREVYSALAAGRREETR